MPIAALKGLTVLSLEQAVAAPYCTSRLADAGARVIKIERPEGDFARGYDDSAKGQSSYFVWTNRGKQSLVADIKRADDLALLNRILGSVDIFIQNLAPGAAARAGFGSDELRTRFPRMITVDISGYGDGNSYEHMKAYDLLVQAESGLCEITGHAAGPGRVGVSVCDIACGMYAYSAVLEALIDRQASGQGRGIKLSLFDCLADWMSVPLLYFEGSGRAPKRVGLAHPTVCPYGAFATSDGSLVLISIQNEREWAAFCERILREPDLPSVPGFETNTIRVANRAAVDARIAATLSELSRAEVAEQLARANIAFGFVNDLEQVRSHPALRRIEVETPKGPVSMAAPPARFDGQTASIGPVPGIGSHTEQIRLEFS
jgi:itaconate CoA-transferase